MIHPPPSLDFAFIARVSVAPAIEGGMVPGGRRRIVPITGGTVEGPMLTAAVLPGGADWQIVRDDGVFELVARYTLQAADGAIIGVVNRVLRHGPADVMARLQAGESVDPALVYFRGSTVFEAPAGAHDWMNRHVFLCSGERQRAEVVIRFFVVR